ncbi:MAG: hypothetical protein JWN70_630 [Planctomycetaceae bacterium]|nr:hypothetical protein [Planctomycetaceae bacterium]
MLLHIATYHHQPRALTGSDYICFSMTALIAYALSPPWLIALFRVLDAPLWFMNAIAFFYAPLTSARINSEAIDTFYHGYRILLNPWLSGV